MPGNRAETRATPHASLRDYWTNPTGFPPNHPLVPRRNTAPVVNTPSLWEQAPLLTPLSARPTAPGDEGTQAVSVFTPPIVAEGIVAPPALHDPDRLQRRGVSVLSDAELLSLVLR